MEFQGKFDDTLFVGFMKRLLTQTDEKAYLIVDGHPVHKSVGAKRFVAENENRLRLILLPGYCPELNPDDLLNKDVKTNALGKSCPFNRSESMATVRALQLTSRRQRVGRPGPRRAIARRNPVRSVLTSSAPV